MKQGLLPICLFFVTLPVLAQPSTSTARRFITGTSLPASCAKGDVFYKTAATEGQYDCTAANTWTLVAGSGGSVPAPPFNSIQFNNAGAFGGNDAFTVDITTDSDFPITLGIRGDFLPRDAVASATALGGTIFKYIGSDGGNTTIATTGIGGGGGDIEFTSGNGGTAPNAVTASTGGAGGAFFFAGGNGGAATVASMGTNVGGEGAYIEFDTGIGGEAANGMTNNGGDGGDFIIGLGSGGSGTTANGVGGSFKVILPSGPTRFAVPRVGGAQIPEVDVSDLPTCNSGAAGTRHSVDNSNAVSFTAGIGAVVAGGGTTHVPVYCDGTNWRIG